MEVVRASEQSDRRFARAGPIAGMGVALLLALSSYGALLASVVYSLHQCQSLICRD